MPIRAKVKTLKQRVSAHRRAVDALAVASRKLHETLDGMIATADGARPGRGTKKQSLKAPRRQHSGVGVESALSDAERARAAALERHWGNLF